MKPEVLLWEWMGERIASDAIAWLREGAQTLESGGSDADLYRIISLVPRRIGKARLALTPNDLEHANQARPQWDPSSWTADQAARTLLLLSMRVGSDDYVRRMDALFATADVGELVAFYQALPLYPDPPRHALRAAEGVRTNMRVVFEAVAHRNPFPSEQFDDVAWNQMVLKTLFVGSVLDPIVGLDRRANPALARMLLDYAHERWAAQRPVSPELWRCVGPFAKGSDIDDLERALGSCIDAERHAAALSLAASPDPKARSVLAAHPELSNAIAAGNVTWQQFAATP